MRSSSPDPRAVEVSSPVYDNMPVGPGSLPPQDVQHHWRTHIDTVDQPERDRRLLGDPMELILAHCGEYPPISHDESLELVERARAGDEQARGALILHFQRFVVWHAKQAYRHAKHLNVPMEDVVQEGMVGLILGADSTDPEIARKKQGTIRSYLSWGINSEICKGLADRSRLIRIPRNLHNQARSLVIVASQLHAELGREPTDFEVAERAGLTPPKPVELMGLDESQEYDEFAGERPEYVINRARSEFVRTMEDARKSVGSILGAARPIKSLDSYVYEPSGRFRPLHEVLADEELEVPAPGPRRKGRTYLDHVSDSVASRRDDHRYSHWLLRHETEDVAEQERRNFSKAVAKRQREKDLAVRQEQRKLAAENAEDNMEALAEEYLSRCDPESLYAETHHEESEYLFDYYRDMDLGQRNSVFQPMLRKYGGLVAFMALSLKPENMSAPKAWKTARRAFSATIAEFKDIGQVGIEFQHEGQRFVDVYCEAAEKAFEAP